ncbi:hypothetical protein [Actinacidiphila oryziradicis]|nr:hypothetical protein [Actinacidiphila oryziradicis]
MALKYGFRLYNGAINNCEPSGEVSGVQEGSSFVPRRDDRGNRIGPLCG